MARKYREYTDNDVIENASKSNCLSDLLRKLGLKAIGGNYNHIRKTLQRLKINCDHWDSKKNKAWSKGKQLKDWSEYSRVENFKHHLIAKRGHKCERCNLAEWQNQKIPLEIEHINGDRTDNNENNLSILCCNCHALTPTWRGRKNKLPKPEKKNEDIIQKECLYCLSKFSGNKKFCSLICSNKYNGLKRIESDCYTKIKWPSIDVLNNMIDQNGYLKTSKLLGVSDNAIRKHIKNRNKYLKTNNISNFL